MDKEQAIIILKLIERLITENAQEDFITDEEAMAIAELTNEYL